MIGWRNAARRIIIYLTDDNIHHALDGLEANIVTPAGKEWHRILHII